jgi:hypothetical protein
MAQVAFPLTSFSDADGSPLANGYLLIHTSDDATVTGTSSSLQICRDAVVKVLLDTTGTITGSPVFWPNSAMSPAGLYYVLRAFSSNGQMVLGPTKVTI